MTQSAPSDSVKAVRAAFAHFDAVQDKYSDVGASDSEPRNIYYGILKKALNGEDVEIPTAGDDWELIGYKTDVDAAAMELHLAALSVLQHIYACPLREIRQVRAAAQYRYGL